MGWDDEGDTLSVMNDGLPDPPSAPIPGVTFAVARHVGERFGAVLFLRLWRNGQWDSDAVITERFDGEWTFPGSYGGGGWPDPYVRPSGNDFLVLGGTSSTEVEGEPVTAYEGMSSLAVKAIKCTTPAQSFVYPIESPLGVFIIAVEGPNRPTFTPLDAHGAALASTEA